MNKRGDRSSGVRVRLISWNLNGRTNVAEAQVASILRLNPDIIALQEVTPSSLSPLRAALERGGMTQIADSFSVAPVEFEPRGPRRYGQLTASHYCVYSERPGRFALPWPERVLSVGVDIGSHRLEVHNTHVPPGASNGWIKIAVLNAIFGGLAVQSIAPRILCGDLNAPQLELDTGGVITWGQRLGRTGEWRVARSVKGRPGREWDAGERRVLTGLREFGMRDVYRSLHGYGSVESSWVSRRLGVERGRRFDHVFASEQLVPVSCRYLHELRVAGLSDHSPIEATFDLDQ